MENEKRDKLLTEKMGEHWHKGVADHGRVCECGLYLATDFANNEWENYGNYSFSTWVGFGKLWEYATKQEWWNDFLIKGHLASEDNEQSERFMSYGSNFKNIIDPNRFADALYGYLKKK